MQKSKIKVIVGVSGGVDSSVTLYLLKQAGYMVQGLFMKNWEEDDTDSFCAAKQDLEDASKVCAELDVPLLTVNFAAEYWDQVFANFLSEYQAGRTPNPDILCNREIKFKAFLDYAITLGADYIATGHYVRKSKQQPAQLLKGVDANKDQSYFLHAISKAAINQSLFPIGELTKPEVRAIAKKLNLKTHAKKDSTGICFIGERKFNAFLSQYLKPNPGLIIDDKGATLGQHQGLMFYTLGQRRGLNIGGLANYPDKPWYVAKKIMATNTLVLVQDSQHPLLLSQAAIIDEVHWINGQFPEQAMLMSKTRYRQADIPCRIEQMANNQVKVYFEQAQSAVTPGQYCVFYHGEICLGGGVIEQTLI